MLELYAQKRITNGEFKFVALPTLEKQDFLSVNYEHPRVAEFLKKAGSLIPAEDESLRQALEKMADGSLADNYKTNKSVDAPLPQTLPGIKLKRPWGSIIRKYERITGKKVPPDPDFPDEDQTRPERRSDATATVNGQDNKGPQKSGTMSSVRWVAAGLACLALGVAISKIFWKKARRKR